MKLKHITYSAVLALCMVIPALTQGTQLQFGHFVDGISGGVRWQTTLMVQNQETTQARFQARFLRSDGGGAQLSFRRRNAGQQMHQGGPDGVFDPGNIGPRFMLHYRTEGAGPFQTGWIQIQSQQRIQVQVMLHAFDLQGTLIDEVTIPPQAPFTSASVFADQSDGALLGLTLCNMSTLLNVDAVLEFYGEDGETPLGTITVTLGPRAHIARLVRELFPGFPAGISFIKITSSGPVCSLALKLRGLDLTAVPIFINP